MVSDKEMAEGQRMKWLRHAEGFKDGAALFAKRVGWSPTQLSNYESGERRVPRDAALQLLRAIPGFDPVWLWTGEERGLSFDLRRRIEEARAADQGSSGEPTSKATTSTRSAS